jgi:hypothetical protein
VLLKIQARLDDILMGIALKIIGYHGEHQIDHLVDGNRANWVSEKTFAAELGSKWLRIEEIQATR